MPKRLLEDNKTRELIIVLKNSINDFEGDSYQKYLLILSYSALLSYYKSFHTFNKVEHLCSLTSSVACEAERLWKDFLKGKTI
jgi:hypothetical protein